MKRGKSIKIWSTFLRSAYDTIIFMASFISYSRTWIPQNRFFGSGQRKTCQHGRNMILSQANNASNLRWWYSWKFNFPIFCNFQFSMSNNSTIM